MAQWFVAVPMMLCRNKILGLLCGMYSAEKSLQKSRWSRKLPSACSILRSHSVSMNCMMACSWKASPTGAGTLLTCASQASSTCCTLPSAHCSVFPFLALIMNRANQESRVWKMVLSKSKSGSGTTTMLPRWSTGWPNASMACRSTLWRGQQTESCAFAHRACASLPWEQSATRLSGSRFLVPTSGSMSRRSSWRSGAARGAKGSSLALIL
mmetsp:Transcript_64159/g.180586  ORF Transcript_64159/g.180586 Transcript_64159/m.180586 type:complete len:211 (+) Transcript_64159:772-1404(+)